VAKYNPAYLGYVEGERQRLGESHPLFQTQYCLNPLHGGGGFLSPGQRAQLRGSHSRQYQPPAAEGGRIYVAGIDLAGEAEEGRDSALRSIKPRQDSTVVTIGELEPPAPDDPGQEPRIRVLEHRWWTGRPHTELYPQLVDVLKNVWGCRRVAVDRTGVGEGVASFLSRALGSTTVIPFHFTQQSKSKLGFELLAAINSGRLKVYAPDGSEECQEFWQELERAKSTFRPNQTMNFFVDPTQGHDDFLMSLALLVEAARGYSPRRARGRLREEIQL
jgi:hypothetical protein